MRATRSCYFPRVPLSQSDRAVLRALTILSPHRDDAAFSLCLCLLRWTAAGVPVTVLDFFTRSEYGPRIVTSAKSNISEIRAREDRSALSRIDRGIRIKALGLLDAPLRLHIPVASVFEIKPEEGAKTDGIPGAAKAAVQARAQKTFLLAPLGLGDHLDHLLVKEAAIANCPSSHLAFYEDLPYAAWRTKAEIRERVRITEEKLGAALRPAVIRHEHGIWRKRRLIRRYQSQIGNEEATEIARFVLKYNGGERIWAPRAGVWKRFLNNYR